METHETEITTILRFSSRGLFCEYPKRGALNAPHFLFYLSLCEKVRIQKNGTTILQKSRSKDLNTQRACRKYARQTGMAEIMDIQGEDAARSAKLGGYKKRAASEGDPA
jgi:hypothetical protein